MVDTPAPGLGPGEAVSNGPPSKEATAPLVGWPKYKKLLIKWFLPVSLVLVIFVGLVWPDPGAEAGGTELGTFLIVGIFFISGLKLKTDEIKRTLGRYKEAALGLTSILLLTPLVAFAVVRLPLEPEEFPTGVALFAVMPSTLSSGYIFTGEARGNQSLALLLSVVTNLMAVVSVPLWLSAVLDSDGVELDVGSLLLKLLLMMLLPLLVGRSLRYFAWVRTQVTNFKNTLKILSGFMLVLIPWMKVSKSSDDLSTVTAGEIAVVFLLGVSYHVVLLVFNYCFTSLFSMDLADRKAVVIMSSQKTLGIAAAVLDFLPASAGSQGLIIVPVIVCHLTQILMDAPLSVRWSTVTEEPVHVVKHNGKRKVFRLDSNGSFRGPPLTGEDCTVLRIAKDHVAEADSSEASPQAVNVDVQTSQE